MDISLVSENISIRQREYSTKSMDKKVATDVLEKANLNDKSEKKVDSRELTLAVDKANKVLFKNNSHLQFRIHDRTKEVMVKIIDDETGEVLREIPPEKMLDMVAKLWEIAGILVDEKI